MENEEMIVSGGPKSSQYKDTKEYKKGLLTGMLVALFLVLVITLGKTIYSNLKFKRVIAEGQSSGSDVINGDVVKKISLIQQQIDKSYYDTYDTETLRDGIYSGMVAALGDKYSTYYSPEDFQKVVDDTSGIYYGIGAYITMDEDTQLCIITGTIEGSPAEEVGLMAEDYIYMVDGVSTLGMESSDVVALIHGEEGTVVTLTIIRGDEQMDVDVTRAKVESPTVEYEMLEDNIGYISISSFDLVTPDQFTDALATLKGKGARGIIIDVRSNLGGSYDAVCQILRQILPEGIIVYTEDKYGNREEETCDGTHELELPLVVLTNGYSASASEILTGAIKDYKKGTIVGTTTFGKGIVQKLFPFTDGSAVKLTIANYFTPSGVCIHGTGIEPDIEVELDYDSYVDKGIDNQLDAAVDEIHRIWEE